MKKTNICFFLISSGWGGAENVVYNLAKTMALKGHQVNIILNEETYPYFKQLLNVNLYNVGPIFSIRNIFQKNFKINIPKILFKNKKISKIIKIILNPYITKINYLKIKKNVLKKIDDIHPDIIHFHNSAVLNFCASLVPQIHYPTIYTSHGIEFKEKKGPIALIKSIKKRRVLKNFASITAVSNYIQQVLKLNKIRSKITVIYNGIDFDIIQNISKNKIKNNTDNQYVLIFPGGQKKQKGGEILLQAIKIVKNKNYNIKLFYCGFVTNDFIDKHQNKDVIFTGLLPHEEYLELLSQCDCLTLFSKTEGFSIALLEALAFGKMILTTNAGGNPELVTDGVNGFFVKRDSSSIAKKIIYLINNPAIRAQISKNNLEIAQNFNWKNITEQYIKLYESLSTI